MVTPYINLPAPSFKFVYELEESGVLPTFQTIYAEQKIMENKESHTWAGLIDFRKSPTLLEWLKRFDMPVDRAALFVNRPGLLTKWHIDGPHVPVALNLYWFGDSLTVTEWCVEEVLDRAVIKNADKSIRRIEMLGVERPATHSTVIDQERASLVDISKFHRIDSRQSRTFRGIISLRFPPTFTFVSLASRLPPKQEVRGDGLDQLE